MIQIDLTTIIGKKGTEEIASLVLAGNIVIVRGMVTISYIKPHPRGFIYDVYDANAKWNEDKSDFDVNALRDGGICIFGDNLDASCSFIDMIHHEESRG